MNFSLLHPQYLFLLIGIPLLFVIYFMSFGGKKKKALKFANFDAIARIEGVDFFSKNVVILTLNIIIIAVLVFAVSGLTLHTTARTSSFSFIIAIDSSQSMLADDLIPDRISVAKGTAVAFVNSAPVDVRFGVISFSGGSKIEKEVTDRKDEVKGAINGIQVSGFGGTDLYEAVVTSSNLLGDEGHKAVVILGDGQINVGSIDDAVDYANKRDVLVHTIGVGTEEGGQTEFGFSKLDEDSLKSLAYNTGGIYSRADNEENLTSAFYDILDLTEKKVSIELFDYLLIFSIILVVFEFFLANTRYVNLP
ncbi:MAG: VWA domain-containing protein [Nanoarchaeota archaeon]